MADLALDPRSTARVLAYALRWAETDLLEHHGVNWRWCGCAGANIWQCTRMWEWSTPQDSELRCSWRVCAFNVCVPRPDYDLVRAAVNITAADLEKHDVDVNRFFISGLIHDEVICTYFNKIPSRVLQDPLQHRSQHGDDICHVNIVAVLPKDCVITKEKVRLDEPTDGFGGLF